MLYRILKFIFFPFFKLFYNFKVVNHPDKLPEGRLILCANHKSFLDPIMLVLAYKGKINFMGKKELFSFKPFGYLLSKLGVFPVDRQGNDIDAVRKSMQILKQDKVLGIFPEGTRIRNPKEISREKFNDGIAMIATRAKANILPVEIEGKYGLFSSPKIIFKEIIDIDKFKNMDKKEQYKKIVDDVYMKIYEL